MTKNHYFSVKRPTLDVEFLLRFWFDQIIYRSQWNVYNIDNKKPAKVSHTAYWQSNILSLSKWILFFERYNFGPTLDTSYGLNQKQVKNLLTPSVDLFNQLITVFPELENGISHVYWLVFVTEQKSLFLMTFWLNCFL